MTRLHQGYQLLAAKWIRTAALALLVLVVAAPLTHPGADQQASRYSMIAAIWDHQTLELSAYEDLLNRDRSVRDGKVYSDKAPLGPLLGVPFYGVYRLLGGEAAETLEGPFGWFDYGLWWVTVWTVTVPGAILAALMFSWAREIEPSTALRASLAVVFGSLIIVYSTMLFGHVLAALFLFIMFLLVRTPDASWGRLFLAGLIGGAAVLVEYPSALVVVVLVIAALVRHKAKALAVVLGGAPSVIMLGIYNAVLFGSPLMYSYRWSAFTRPRDSAGAFLGAASTGPSIDRLVDVLFSERGLIVATPIVALAVVGLVLLWSRGHRWESAVVGLAFLIMLALQASWPNSYAGGAGPRYLTPVLPFLVAPVAVAWKKWDTISMLLAGLSVLTMMSAIFTQPQLPSELRGGLGYWLTAASNGAVASSVFTLNFQAWGWAIHGLSIGVALAILYLSRRANEDSIQPAYIR